MRLLTLKYNPAFVMLSETKHLQRTQILHFVQNDKTLYVKF